MKRKTVFILFLVLTLISTHFLIAQGGPPGDGGPPPPPANGNTNDISITTFLWVLALAGAYLGFKKVK